MNWTLLTKPFKIPETKEDILHAITMSKHLPALLESFSHCTDAVRAEIIQQTVYQEITEGMVHLFSYVIHTEQDSYIKKLAFNILQSRLPLKMRVLQSHIVS